MENRVYYGQYSLKHWLDLILKGNIILPNYQRHFVWNETKVRTLIDTFKKKQFVPPITIGAFKKDDANQNLILDGQQRLTSILLAYLGLYPDEATYKTTTVERLANENDDDDSEDEPLDNIFDWTFKNLTIKGKNKEDILSHITTGNYKTINFDITEDFLKKTFLGFSFLVPDISDQQEQQKYYSSVFRNINIQGETLMAQESRASLYFLSENFTQFFDPDFAKNITIKTFSTETKLDFVRFSALLSQYAKEENSNQVARGYKPKMEKYYEEYIYSVVGESPSPMFKDFTGIFPDSDYQRRFNNLAETIESLGIPKQFTSIIELDMYLMGLIYVIVFEDKIIDVLKKDELCNELVLKIAEYKAVEAHKKAPSALKYLKDRIDTSIDIYKNYINE